MQTTKRHAIRNYVTVTFQKRNKWMRPAVEMTNCHRLSFGWQNYTKENSLFRKRLIILSRNGPKAVIENGRGDDSDEQTEGKCFRNNFD